MQQDKRYDYSTAGFSPFLTRSLDDAGGSGLNDAPSRAFAFDRSVVSGKLGDKYNIGRIVLDGVAGSITVLSEDGQTANFYLGPKQ